MFREGSLKLGKIVDCRLYLFIEKFTDGVIDEYTVDSHEKRRPRTNKSKHIVGEERNDGRVEEAKSSKPHRRRACGNRKSPWNGPTSPYVPTCPSCRFIYVQERRHLAESVGVTGGRKTRGRNREANRERKRTRMRAKLLDRNETKNRLCAGAPGRSPKGGSSARHNTHTPVL